MTSSPFKSFHFFLTLTADMCACELFWVTYIKIEMGLCRHSHIQTWQLCTASRHPSSFNSNRSTQGGGGSFKNRKPIGAVVVVVNHGWQSEATDGPNLSVYLSICLQVYLSICLSVYLSISVCLSVCPVCLSVYLACNFLNLSWTWQRQKRSNSARLPHFWTWQHQKRSNSARLPHFSKLTTSKTKQFCETSFKNGKLSAELTASYQCVLRFFQSTCLKYCACHEKVMPGHTKCCTCHAKSSQQTWRSDAPKCNPSQEISALTS